MAPPLHAAEVPTAADVTEPGRSVERAVEVVVTGRPDDKDADRTLVLLVDATPSVAALRLPDVVEAVLRKKAALLARTRIGVARAGEKGKLRLAPSTDHAAIVSALRDAVAGPKQSWANLHADMRKIAGTLGKAKGSRELLLVCLDNGDLEDDLESTVKSLKRARVRAHFLTGESYVGDTLWWTRGSATKPPNRLQKSIGGDGAFAQVPWGWLVQQNQCHEESPSGYGPYGFSRLASASGGRVFLYSAPGGKHSCVSYGTCPFCANDHAPTDMGYQSQRLRPLAPLVGSRSSVLSAAGKDPSYRAVVSAWAKASKAGLVRSKPSVRAGGGALKPEKYRTGRWLELIGSSPNWTRNIRVARKGLTACDAISKELGAFLKKSKREDSRPRYRAIAELTYAQLRVTRFNLLSYIAFCERVGPVMMREREVERQPPEIDRYGDDVTFVGITYMSLSMCHGLRSFESLYLGWDEKLMAELRALDAELAPLRSRHAHTPFGIALRRMGIARYTPTVRGKATPIPPKDRDNSSTEGTTTPDRPGRAPGGGSSPGTSGPTTGGG